MSESLSEWVVRYIVTVTYISAFYLVICTGDLYVILSE